MSTSNNHTAIVSIRCKSVWEVGLAQPQGTYWGFYKTEDLSAFLEKFIKHSETEIKKFRAGYMNYADYKKLATQFLNTFDEYPDGIGIERPMEDNTNQLKEDLNVINVDFIIDPSYIVGAPHKINRTEITHKHYV